ncbi:MAG: shikimate dehydrogenase [Myxococcaceae bacterium]
MAGRLVVTLPPEHLGADALAFARRAKRCGAHLLELRTDLHPADTQEVSSLAEVLPLIVSERRKPLPPSWKQHATWTDQERAGTSLLSFHSPEPLSTESALELWGQLSVPEGAMIKHVEPTGPTPAKVERLFATQAALAQRYGKDRVTVLATGAWALPWRCLLAKRNALDYVALDSQWAAAPGQRLLADAVRERKGRPADSRAGILGSSISHSRSPRIHPQPFDRIELPPDAPVGELVDALQPHYRGFAVTSPFKKVLAVHLGVPLPAVNTLVRRGHGYDGENTDVEGAKRIFERLKVGGPVSVLGDGGATVALRIAAEILKVPLKILRRAEISDTPLEGPVVWTWPPGIELPSQLRFASARVAVIAYGAPGRLVAKEVRERAGVPVLLGAAWLIAQARGQRRLWESGT